MSHRTRILSPLLLIGLALVVSGCAATFRPAAAVVNGKTISQEALEREVERAKAGQASAGGGSDDEIARQELAQMIQSELIKQEAARRGVTVAERQIDETLDQIKSQFPSEADFQQALQARGFTLESLRSNLRERLLGETLAERIAGPITDEQVRAVYERERARFEERTARHILIGVQDPSADARAKAKAERIKEQLDDGASFTRLAREESDDPGSKDQGGSVGIVTRDSQLVPEFLEAVFAAERGEVTDPVRSQFGYHLIRVDRIDVKSLREAEAEIRSQLRQQVTQQAIGELLSRATVRVNPRYGDWDPRRAAVVPHQSFVPAPPEPDPNAPQEQEPVQQLPPGLQPGG